jgi:peptide/nickel transport system ATP-binding protein
MSARPSLLVVENLEVNFPAAGMSWPGSPRHLVRAVNGISFTLNRGESLGLVGESGCGKTTLGRAILHLGETSSGSVYFAGQQILSGDAGSIKTLRRETAMIFQDPYAALNPLMTVGDTIAEVLRVHRKVPTTALVNRVGELLSLVGLSPEFASRKPATLSGGQCQRVGIARALAVEPKLIIADECVAALDVSIQAQIINLLSELRRRMHLALIFIAHDLSVIRHVCDRVAVIYLGRIVEEGPTAQVFLEPKHPYTQALIRAIPAIDPARSLSKDLLSGEPPSPLDLPPGCPFYLRCPFVMDVCRKNPAPSLRPNGVQHVACHLYSQVQQ